MDFHLKVVIKPICNTSQSISISNRRAPGHLLRGIMGWGFSRTLADCVSSALAYSCEQGKPLLHRARCLKSSVSQVPPPAPGLFYPAIGSPSPHQMGPHKALSLGCSLSKTHAPWRLAAHHIPLLVLSSHLLGSDRQPPRAL